MKYGAPFIGSFAIHDPVAIRDYVQAVEGLGYDYLCMDEVLLNDNPREIFHESLTLFAHLSALTTTLKFVSSVMILPVRSTFMVARQAAEVDLLSNGRLTLGVGVGWNEREFKAFGIDFPSRGKRIEDQISFMRELWTKTTVTYRGEYHELEAGGINLLPVQRPIPIWIGGDADIVLRRAARLGDGWIATLTSEDKFRRNLQRLHGHLTEFGRSNQGFRIIRYLRIGGRGELQWGKMLDEWQDMGITHTFVLPSVEPGTGTTMLQESIDALRAFKADY